MLPFGKFTVLRIVGNVHVTPPEHGVDLNCNRTAKTRVLVDFGEAQAKLNVVC